MSAAWFLGSLVVPAVAALLAFLLGRDRRIPDQLAVWLNAVLPGAGLAAQGRPVLEVILGVLMAQASLIVVGATGDGLGFYLPTMVIGGAWAWLHTAGSPLSARRSPVDAARPAAVGTPANPGSTTAAAVDPRGVGHERDETADDFGYCLEVRCTECGADVEVPVLHRAARCVFCGSDHLVVGHDETLYVAIPSRVVDPEGLRDVVLDHYRYLHYLQLYQRSVAPLERQATEVSPSGVLVNRPDLSAAAAAAEAAVSRKADAYRSRLARTLTLGTATPFLAPYRHGVGTMFQAAFGRSHRDQEKQLRFAVATLEAPLLATTVCELPPMGKLSYLRALRPAASLPEEARSLPLDVDPEALARAYGDLDRKQLVRDLQVIRVGSRFHQEVAAVVWRPWWIVEVGGAGLEERLLVDAAAGSVAGHAPSLGPADLQPLPPEARAIDHGLRFAPMECPTCGHEFPFDVDAVLHFCHNCHRLFEVDERVKREVPYAFQVATSPGDDDLVPFWRFPLALDTTDGRRLADMWHLKDGIDGTLDQIGEDAPEQQHAVCLPAIRCRHPRLMAAAFASLFRHSARRAPRLVEDRFPLDEKPRPWAVDLEEDLARDMLPLFLATAFDRRDLARVNVHQVEAWLFKARQSSPGRLVFLRLPRAVTEPFRRYLGRSTAAAVRSARGES